MELTDEQKLSVLGAVINFVDNNIEDDLAVGNGHLAWDWVDNLLRREVTKAHKRLRRN